MATIFINYRTADELGATMLIARELSRHFGDDTVFLAIDTIPPGTDFERELLRRARSADVLLAVVGTNWLTATSPDGGRALDRDEDWVRREIAEALHYGIRVIPILVDGAERLSKATLPADIAPVATLQHLRFRHEDSEHDLARIIDQLTTHVPALHQLKPTGRMLDGQQTVGLMRLDTRVTGGGDAYVAARDQTIHGR